MRSGKPIFIWANLYLYKYEKDSILRSIQINTLKFHGIYRFINDLCAINDSEEFGSSYETIYPPELELKKEYSGKHATFLDWDISKKMVSSFISYMIREMLSLFPLLGCHIFAVIYLLLYFMVLLNQRCLGLLRTHSLSIRMLNQVGSLKNLIRYKSNVVQKLYLFFQSFSKFVHDIANDIEKTIQQ